MTNPITTSYIDLFLEGVRAKFYEVYSQGDDQLRLYDATSLFDTMTNVTPLIRRINATGKQKLETIYTTGLVGYLEPREEAQPFPMAEYLKGIITEVQPFQFARSIRVTRESYERRSPEYASALDEAKKVRQNAILTASKHIFDWFNNVRTAPASLPPQLFPYGDGVRFASTQHPLVGGGVGSNILSTSPALSIDALESGILLAQNTVDDTGKPMPYMSGQIYLVVPPALVRRAWEIAETPNTPYTNNFVANIFQGRYIAVESPYLGAPQGGSNTRWFLVDAANSPIVHIVFKDITAEDWFDNVTKTYVFDVHGEWKIGAFNWRGVIVSEGNSSTITD